MYMGESFKTILEEYEIDPIDYSEVMSSVSSQSYCQPQHSRS